MIPRLTTLSDIVRTGAERFEDRIALQPVSQGAKHLDVYPEARAFTYRELWNRARRGASALRGRGLQPGDRVLLAAPSSPDWLVAFFSIVEAELVAVPIPDAIGAPLVAAVAHHTGARLCIAGSNQRGLTGALGHVACVTMTELLAEGSSLGDLSPGSKSDPTRRHTRLTGLRSSRSPPEARRGPGRWSTRTARSSRTFARCWRPGRVPHRKRCCPCCRRRISSSSSWGSSPRSSSAAALSMRRRSCRTGSSRRCATTTSPASSSCRRSSRPSVATSWAA